MADRIASRAAINKMLSTCTDNPDEVAKVYDIWAKDGRYDKDAAFANQRGPEFAADELEVFFPENRAGVRILDVAAGSGRSAVELRRRGFTNLDALDPSQKMLDQAREKQLYQKYTCALINEKPVNIPGDTYDVVVCVGAIGLGHLPAIGVIELLRLTKKGGVLAIIGRATDWNELPEYSDKMTKLIKHLEEQGRLNVIKWTTRPDYMFSGKPDCVDGIIIIARKL